MNYKLRSVHGLRQTLPVEQICLVEGELRMGERGFKKTLLAGGEVIEANDAVPCGEQAINHMTADKTGCAGN